MVHGWLPTVGETARYVYGLGRAAGARHAPPCALSYINGPHGRTPLLDRLAGQDVQVAEHFADYHQVDFPQRQFVFRSMP